MSGPSSPEVHILMPAHNSAEYIEPAVQSALAQSYQPLRILIYDDGSNDNTNEILGRLADSVGGRVQVTRSSVHWGVAHARNQLIALSGDLNPQAPFLWLDSDDRFLDDRCLEKIMAQMRRTSADVCLYNFEIHWEEPGPEALMSSAVVLAEKVQHEHIVALIAGTPGETVSVETCPQLLSTISAEWVKAHAAGVKRHWPSPVEGLLYEDNPTMAALLNAVKVTAVNEPMVNYLRRSGSVTGRSIPRHFLRDRPGQLRRFMEHVDRTSPAKTRAAAGFIAGKLKRAGMMLDQLIEAGETGFDESVRAEFEKIRQDLISESSAMGGPVLQPPA